MLLGGITILIGLFVLCWSSSNSLKTGAHRPLCASSPQGVRDDQRFVYRLEMGRALAEGLTGLTGHLSERIRIVKERLSVNYGFKPPPLRIQDSTELEINDYRILLCDTPTSVGTLYPTMSLAINIQGERPMWKDKDLIADPVFGLPSVWVGPEFIGSSESVDCLILDSLTVLATHLFALAERNLAALLTFEETDRIVQEASRYHGKLVAEVFPHQIGVGALLRVFRGLVADRVSIGQIITIFEAIQEAMTLQTKSEAKIVSHVRFRLARQIVAQYKDESGRLHIILLREGTAELLVNSVPNFDLYADYPLRGNEMQELIFEVRRRAHDTSVGGHIPVVVTGSDTRLPISKLLEKFGLDIPILGYNEICEYILPMIIAEI